MMETTARSLCECPANFTNVIDPAAARLGLLVCHPDAEITKGHCDNEYFVWGIVCASSVQIFVALSLLVGIVLATICCSCFAARRLGGRKSSNVTKQDAIRLDEEPLLQND